MRGRMPALGSTMAAPRQGTSSVSGRRYSRCSLIVRRLQGLLSSEPGDELRAASGIWLRRDPEGAFYHQQDSATGAGPWRAARWAYGRVNTAWTVMVLFSDAMRSGLYVRP